MNAPTRIGLLLMCFVIPVSAQTQSFEVLNPRVDQGGILIVRIDSRWMPPATKNPAISVFDKHYLPNKYGEVFIGIDPGSSTYRVDSGIVYNEIGPSIVPGKYLAFLVEYGIGSQLNSDRAEIEVVARSFPRRFRPPFRPPQKWYDDRVAINTAFLKGDQKERYFIGDFIRPLKPEPLDGTRSVGDITSSFGHTHNGVDLRTLNRDTMDHQRPIMAINSGKIALAGSGFLNEGSMVIIDHGSDIFSVYMHLSALKVAKGDMVSGSQVIAMSGNTGSVIGPNLHFSVRAGGVYVDPLGFIETANEVLK